MINIYLKYIPEIVICFLVFLYISRKLNSEEENINIGEYLWYVELQLFILTDLTLTVGGFIRRIIFYTWYILEDTEMIFGDLSQIIH